MVCMRNDIEETRMTLSIDCGDCVMANTSACDDCIVSFIVNREPGDALVIDADEARALRLLGDAGLVPESRHRPRTIAGVIPIRLVS